MTNNIFHEYRCIRRQCWHPEVGKITSIQASLHSAFHKNIEKNYIRVYSHGSKTLMWNEYDKVWQRITKFSIYESPLSQVIYGELRKS